MVHDSQSADSTPKPTIIRPAHHAKVKKLKRPIPAPKDKPTKPLPTERITFPRQLDLLRAYSAASGPNGKAVTNAEVASIIKMTPGTVSIANAFFSDAGLLTRTDGGYLPAPDVVSFQRAYEWNPENASQKLGPLISSTWFAKALLPKLTFNPMEEGEAITTLAEAVSAGPDYRSQLKVCLEYMAAGGLVQKDGNLYKLVKNSGQGVSTDRPASPEPRESVAPRPNIATAFAQPTEGVVQFHVSVKVDMKEFEGWQPERIASFFSGIAQVLAAKGTIEKAGSTS